MGRGARRALSTAGAIGAPGAERAGLAGRGAMAAIAGGVRAAEGALAGAESGSIAEEGAPSFDRGAGGGRERAKDGALPVACA